jgi:hypothetical protein
MLKTARRLVEFLLQSFERIAVLLLLLLRQSGSGYIALSSCIASFM